jgi:hypothetical protein
LKVLASGVITFGYSRHWQQHKRVAVLEMQTSGHFRIRPDRAAAREETLNTYWPAVSRAPRRSAVAHDSTAG